MQQFAGQSSLRMVNPPVQPRRWCYFCFTDMDSESVAMDIHKPPLFLFQALLQSFFSRNNGVDILKKKISLSGFP